MRKGEFRGGEDPSRPPLLRGGEEEKVDIDDAVVVVAHPTRLDGTPHLALDLLRQVQQVERLQRGLQGQATIAEAIIGLKPPWFGIVERRTTQHLTGTLLQEARGFAEVLLAVTKVAAEAEII